MIPEFVPISYLEGLKSSTSTKKSNIMLWSITEEEWVMKDLVKDLTYWWDTSELTDVRDLRGRIE